MKIKIKVEKVVDVKTLHVEAVGMYWEDATVNGKEDTEGNLIPCRKDDAWCPIINVDTGIILNWKKGTVADIHYKVRDGGRYWLKDADGETVASIEDGYVPSLLSPEEEGYGDYMIMKVDKNGQIGNWIPDLDDFTKEKED